MSDRHKDNSGEFMKLLFVACLFLVSASAFAAPAPGASAPSDIILVTPAKP